ncbi:MAG: DUF2384 domain-containing protein [Opitutales bacterium]|nr:DUF2384 domain-containing protein [Opitutales bacterium]
MSTVILRKTSVSKSSARINSGPALMTWRRQRGISRKLFAQLADCSERKLATYEVAPKLPPKVKRPVMETVRLLQALRELTGEDAKLKKWLDTPNPAFGQKTPLELIRNGESDLLWEMVYQIRQGAFA